MSKSDGKGSEALDSADPDTSRENGKEAVVGIWTRMLIGLAATTLGAAPLGLRLWLADLDDVRFLGSIVVFGITFLCVLVLCLVRFAYTRESTVECLIARASLAPGTLNTFVFGVAPFVAGGSQ